MMSDVETRLKSLTFLGEVFQRYARGERQGEMLLMLDTAVERAEMENPWFTGENILLNIRSWAEALANSNVKKWTGIYGRDIQDERATRKIGMVMAGNIPMVGLHDLLCVYLSGHIARVKLSGQDKVLLPAVADILSEHDPSWKNKCAFTEGKLDDFDAIIATGSNNSSRYFEYYFGKYPHVIRRNRSSLAVITGKESQEELDSLALDIFAYFGLGCRNVSKLYLPAGYDLTRLFPSLEKYKGAVHHHKYANNYDYQKSILIVNSIPHFDPGPLLLKEDEALVSPISVVHYEHYEDLGSLKAVLDIMAGNIQCVAGKDRTVADVDFGRTQFPSLWEYADRVDIMKFLLSL